MGTCNEIVIPKKISKFPSFCLGLGGNRTWARSRIVPRNICFRDTFVVYMNSKVSTLHGEEAEKIPVINSGR